MPENNDTWPELRPFTVRYVILSRSRPQSVSSHALFPQATLVVPDSQVESYRHYGMEIVAIPDARTGISAVRNWIIQRFDEDVKVMLDDDLTSLVYMAGHKHRKLNPAETAFVVEQTAACALGCGARIFCWNQRPDPKLVQRNDPFKVDKWTGGALGVIGSVPLWDENLKIKCDVDACLNSLLRNRIIWQDSRYSFVQLRDKNMGGNSQFRTVERVEAEKRYIEGKWKAHVSFGKYKGQERVAIHVKRKQSVQYGGE
jgi:hypothetical protein